WAAAHVDDVARYYDEHKKEYDRDTEVHIRRVLVRKPKEGGDAALAEARAKAEALLAEARAEGADFEAIAREKSEGYYKNYGGDMGWQSKENSSPKDFEVYAALTAGQISDVQESPIGFWFVRAEEIKPAMKKTLDEVRDEIGTILAGEAKRTEAARAAAEAVLAKVKAGAKLSEAAPMKQAPAPAAPEGEAPEGDAPEAASPEPVSTLESTGPFSADRPAWDRIPGIGKSAELAAKLDALTAEAPLVDQVLEVEGRLFVVALKERVEPDDEAFAKDRETFERRLRIGRANQLFGNWKAVVYGPVRQREVFRRFTGGALLDVLDHAEGVRLNDELYPPPAAPALPEGAMPIKLN
ncbi:MAG: peptidyl-prolyl cis-trans isomerase, partial [Myxococcales bacterium]|nr:peptidyl-prolyl cis-trans isomerase [Myxococcales bacterium]